jgi:hypothetical protein
MKGDVDEMDTSAADPNPSSNQRRRLTHIYYYPFCNTYTKDGGLLTITRTVLPVIVRTYASFM